MIERLSSSLGTKEQQHNIDLAVHLATTKDADGIAEIVDNLSNKNKSIANDCIKVVYEIGKIDPQLIAPYTQLFMNLLSTKNNRMIWGAMMAVSQTVEYNIALVASRINDIISTYKNGSVITIDYSISTLAQIAKSNLPEAQKAFDIIIEHLGTCPAKEVPQHGERAYLCIDSDNCVAFEQVLISRIGELSPTQKKRVNKLLKMINSGNFI